MMICFDFRKNSYCICIGYKSKWFSQLSFFSITREFFDDNDKVSYAEIVYKTQQPYSGRE